MARRGKPESGPSAPPRRTILRPILNGKWVEDFFDATYYEVSPSVNPLGPKTGESQVLRGGSWFFIPTFQRSSYRGDGFGPEYSSSDIGLRVKRIP